MNRETKRDLDWEAEGRLDELCGRYQSQAVADWDQLERILARVPDCERPILLYELLRIDLLKRISQGGARSEAAYVQRFADSAEIVRAVFAEVSPDPESPLPLGTRIGRYRLEGLLGEGVFGRVYLGFDEQLQRQIALKLGYSAWLRPSQTEQLMEEARVLAGFNHPGIVPLYDIQRDSHHGIYLVMEYVGGGSLADRLADGPMPWRDAVSLMESLARALHYAHSQQVIHRDLKPSNVLLDESGHPLLADFGLALHEAEQARRAGELAGTCPYMAPEQLRGRSEWLDGRSDLWALGVMLYELVSGCRPFVGCTPEQLVLEIEGRSPKPLKQRGLPAELDAICARCLAPEVTDRFATAEELAEELAGLLRPQRVSRRGWLVGAGVLGTAGLVAAGIPGSRRRQEPATGSIDLLVWRKSEQWLYGEYSERLEPPVLYDGDRVRLEVLLERPESVVLFWLDSRGKVTPLYPWDPGTWDLASWPDAVDELRLPAEHEGVGWPLVVDREGLECVVMMVGDRPVEASHVIQSLGSLTVPEIARPSIDQYVNGRRRRRHQLRKLDVGQPTTVHDVVDAFHQDLLRRLTTPFHSLTTLSFSVRKGAPA